MILRSVEMLDPAMRAFALDLELLAHVAAGGQAGAIRRLLDAGGGRGRDGCLLRALPAVGIELVAGAAGLGPVVLAAAATEREQHDHRDQGSALHSQRSPHRGLLLRRGTSGRCESAAV